MNFYYPKKVIFSGRVVHNPYLCSIGSCIIKIKKKNIKTSISFIYHTQKAFRCYIVANISEQLLASSSIKFRFQYIFKKSNTSISKRASQIYLRMKMI